MAKPNFKLKLPEVADSPELQLHHCFGISDERALAIAEKVDALETLVKEDGSTDKMTLLQKSLDLATSTEEGVYISMSLGGYFANCDRERAADEKLEAIISKIFGDKAN